MLGKKSADDHVQLLTALEEEKVLQWPLYNVHLLSSYSSSRITIQFALCIYLQLALFSVCNKQLLLIIFFIVKCRYRVLSKRKLQAN